MADYKRIVSYIYQYNHQVKGNNVGFTRIETRNGQCKIIVHVRVPNLQDVTAEVYTYCWYDGVMHGVSLGKMMIADGVGEFKLRAEADNLCGTHYHLADMGGILVYITDKSFLGTEWDDRSIQFNVLLMDEEKPKDYSQRRNYKGEVLNAANVEVASAGESPVELFEESQQEDMLEIEEVSKPVEVSKQAEVSEQADEPKSVEQSPLSKQRMQQLDKQAQELFGNMLNDHIFETKEELEQTQIRPSIEVSTKAAIEYFTAFKSCESEEEYLEVQEEIERLHVRIGQLDKICKEWKIKCARLKEMDNARMEAEQEKLKVEEEIRRSLNIDGADEIYSNEDENSMLRAAANEEGKSRQEGLLDEEEDDIDNDDMEEDSGRIHPVVQRILARYPSISPFVDIEADQCVQIQPQDIGIFPMENWILANNSFLLHGYYSYRHLIFFCKKAYGKQVYLLGIPGVNHSRERFMANMFGFSMFQPLTRVEQDGVQAASNTMAGNPAYDETQGGEFGYWCMEIVF